MKAFASPLQEYSNLAIARPSTASNTWVLLVHGLNTKPSAMDELASELRKLGFGTARLTLSGHESDYQGKPTISLDQWLEDLRQAYRQLQTAYPDCEIYALGYSLGSALIEIFKLRYSDIEIKKTVLLAPPIALRSYTNLLRPLLVLRHLNLELPSFTPKLYRQRDYTPLSAYQALFEASDTLTELSKPATDSLDSTLALLSRDDEFISLDATRRWIMRNRITSWQLEPVEPKPLEGPKLKHLLIDERSLGASEWHRLIGLIGQFFLSK